MLVLGRVGIGTTLESWLEVAPPKNSSSNLKVLEDAVLLFNRLTTTNYYQCNINYCQRCPGSTTNTAYWAPAMWNSGNSALVTFHHTVVFHQGCQEQALMIFLQERRPPPPRVESCIPGLLLVGGWTNPLEVYLSNWKSSPIFGVKIKNMWNHH